MLKKKKNKNKKEKGDTSSYEPSIYDESEDEMLSKKKIKKWCLYLVAYHP